MSTWYKARKKPIEIEFREAKSLERIETLEGTLWAMRRNHFIIKGVKGEIYPIDKEIFYKTYDVIGEKTNMAKEITVLGVLKWIYEQTKKAISWLLSGKKKK